MDPASRHCACKHGTVRSRVFGEQTNYHAQTYSLLAKSYPVQFFPVSNDKKHLNRMHFEDVEDIQNNTMTAVKAKYKFQKCFEGRKKWGNLCIASQGNYFDRDHSATQQ
jgi:hypothetical protein